MQYDAILVLGRGVNAEGAIPKSALACIKKARDLINQSAAPVVIMSGRWSRHLDFVPPVTEAAAMKRAAIEMGVPAEAVLVEDSSLDTISNIYFVKTKYLVPNNWRNVLMIVVSEHGNRVQFLAQNILGPEYHIDIQVPDFTFPPEKHAEQVESEEKKLQLLEAFFRDNHLKSGDHEQIMRAHQDYIKAHLQKTP